MTNQKFAVQIRRKTLKIITKAKAVHIGSNFSTLEIPACWQTGFKN